MAASISARLAVTPLTMRGSSRALHLQAVGAVVLEALGLQQRVQAPAIQIADAHAAGCPSLPAEGPRIAFSLTPSPPVTS